MKAKKSIYELELHESLCPNNWTTVVRVPGGWIYLFLNPPSEDYNFGVFVPHCNEFRKSE